MTLTLRTVLYSLQLSRSSPEAATVSPSQKSDFRSVDFRLSVAFLFSRFLQPGKDGSEETRRLLARL